MICSGFTEVLVRSDKEPSILALNESAATALKLDRCDHQGRRECTVRFTKQRTGREQCEGCERCCENEFGLPRQTLRTRGPRRIPSPDLLVKYSVAMVNRYRRGPDGKTAYELRARSADSQGHCRILPRRFSSSFLGSRRVLRELSQDGRTESSMVCLTGVTSSR